MIHAPFAGAGTSVVPTVGWHIDPFGHTTTQPMLFAKMGFNMFQFGRAPADAPPSFADGHNATQFVWRLVHMPCG